MPKAKTVFVSGKFNILHPGHVRLFRFARELGGQLIVGVLSDREGGEGIHVSEELRLESVQSNNWVTDAFLVDESVSEVLQRIQPDIVVKGKEYEDTYNPELDILRSYGGQLVFSSGEVVFSSVDLIRKALPETNFLQLHHVEKYAQRHDFTLQSLAQVVCRFSELKVAVLGDLIIDEYITCDPLGMSQEDPTIVVTPVDQQRFIGGAGIVAAHAVGLGAQAYFYSVAGEDATREYAETALTELGVDAYLLIDQNRPTPLKQRFRAHHKTLLRVSYLHQASIGKKLQDALEARLTKVMTQLDVLIFSDFNYGCLPQPLVEKVTALCQANGVIMMADSQCSSQIGDVSRFKAMHMLTPTEREARISLRNQEDGLVVIAERLRRQSDARNIMLKLGSEGVVLHFIEEGEPPQTDRLPALNEAPLDVAGAGDSMLITSSLALAAGASAWQAAALGSIAAGIQVSRLGNEPLSKSALLRVMQRSYHYN